MKKKLIIILPIIVVTIALLIVGIFHIVGMLQNREKQKEQEKLVKQYTDNKIAMFTEENNSKSSVQVAFLGDSLTDGYNLPLYFPQYTTTNRGIGGDTTFRLEERLKVSAFDIHPEVVVMLIGANNIDTMFDNYERILQQLKDNLPNSKILLLSLSAMGGEWGKKNNIAIQNNQRIKSLALKYGYIFVDIFTPLFNVDTNEIYPEYTTDGGHWTSLGYEVVTNTITPILESLLEE